MKLSKIVVAILMVGLLASSAFATPSHVKIAPNGKGDVLIFPFYAALDGGLETKLTVVNTSQTQSTVAKLVVRSYRYSAEVLNFFIYLSPADVWTGTIKWDPAQNAAIMYSEDDSAQSAVGVWADEVPMNVKLKDFWLNEEFGDLLEIGYVYVINAATSSGEQIDTAAAEIGERPEIGNTARNINKKVAKPFIKKWFDDVVPDDEYYQHGDDFLPQNILAGWMDFNLNGFYTSKLQATTLRDYRQNIKPTLGQDTLLGFDWMEGSIQTSMSHIAQVEASLAKNQVVMPYQRTATDASIHFFNFPTKYSRIAEITTLPSAWEYEVLTGGLVIPVQELIYPQSPFFNQNAQGITSEIYPELKELCIKYAPAIFDLEENKTEDPEEIFSPIPRDPSVYMCFELDWVPAANFPYVEGAAHYNFQSRRATNLPVTEVWQGYVEGDCQSDQITRKIGYTGVPVIPFVVEVGSSGLSMAYGSWNDGQVSVDNAHVPFYQYADKVEDNFNSVVID